MRDWTPYSGLDGPRSPGRMLLSEFLELFYDCQWGEGAADIQAAFSANDGDSARTLFSTLDFLGSLVAEGTIAGALRPIGGGTPLAMRQGLWEVDAYDARFRTSAISLEEWSDPAATPTHWIFVSEADVDKFLDSWRTNTFNEPVTLDIPDAAARDGQQLELGGQMESDGATVLRLPAVMAHTGLSRSTIYERIAAGSFPLQVRLGPRAAGWYKHEVDAWVRSRRPMQSAGR